jgi:hypothetical protein
MPDDPKKTKFADEERTKLQTAASDLAKENQALKDRLAGVHKKIDRVAKNPTAGERLRTIFLPKKQEPLEKLGAEVREINAALLENQRKQNEATRKLDALNKADQPKVKSGVGQDGAPTRTTVADSLKQKGGVPKPTPQGISQQELPKGQVSPVPYTPYLEPEKSPRVSQDNPLRGRSSSSDYAASLESEKSLEVSQGNPLRGKGSSSDYAPSFEPEESPKVSQNNPLRGKVSPSDYAAHLEPDPLRGAQVSGDYTVHDPPEEQEVEVDPLREEPTNAGYTVYEGPGEQEVEVEVDPLRGPQTSSSYTVYEEPEQQEEVVAVDPLRNAPNYKVYDPGEQEEDLLEPGQEVEQGQSGPGLKENAQFKMKPMGDRYIKGEKEAPKKKVQVGGQEVEVHQKEWIREVHNDKMRETGGKEISQEEWDKRGLAAKQATTQYLNEEQRQSHKVKIEGGVLKGNDGQKLKDGERIFVMDGQGQLYAQKDGTLEVDDKGKKVHMHHSSFLAGEEVAGAGEIRVDSQGQLKEVTDRSGHYKPGEEQTQQTLEEIERQGASLDNVKFTMDRGVEKTGGMAREYLQGQVTPEEQQHRAERQKAGLEVSDTSHVMEKTFKDRHNVVDQIKDKGESVRSMLKKTGNMERIENAPKHGVGKVK